MPQTFNVVSNVRRLVYGRWAVRSACKQNAQKCIADLRGSGGVGRGAKGWYMDVCVACLSGEAEHWPLALQEMQPFFGPPVSCSSVAA